PRVRAIPVRRLMVAGANLRASDSVSVPARGASVGPDWQLKVNLFCGVGCYSPWSSSVLPAHAGVIPPAWTCNGPGPRAPRARGDDPPTTTPVLRPLLCAPRTRG